MCPPADAPIENADQEMVAIDTTTPHISDTSASNVNSTNGTAAAQPPPVKAHKGVYGRASDFLSNTSNWKIIESTLREGEQFANAFFSLETKIKIAKMLDEFGVEYIELTSPAASPESRAHCEAICNLGLKRTKILTHIRCHMDDARLAVETGVDGVDVVIGTSSFLREHSHGKDMTWITKKAIEVIEFVKSKGIEIRFSSEDSFRSELVDLLSIYRTVDKIGVNRVGVADTVGCADARQVYDLVRTLRGVVSCDIETHFHNDTGCAIANAYAALEAGATHVDTSILGIGERNGITPLGGLIARMMVADPDYVKSKYNLSMLRELENTVAEAVEIQVPFNNYITGFCAFTHKAGIHAKAILANPSTYEILNPADFGMTRYVSIGHRLTGWNAVKSRVKDATAKIKELADVRTQSMEDVDMILRIYHTGIQNGDLKVGQSAVLDRLLEKHMPTTRDNSPSGKSVDTAGNPAKRARVGEPSA
ncbi:homocitrate synthase, mitochondrial [Cryptococcus wingfieldii CBS 7118]|uniref:homocitrate synthase n=1 Tax=Cryptococcus wingfieldii CBS 7118 TaxID=1295528 RepID=A0A1E3J6A9_9TREE|nr:homocitrate synthase, mitochondrial [Cryptococcus wingfieldii CBS 7118]ODN96394.1 homocitrate synthase, mitochondrial [Cryptococcus wingfieldii CBS 7118]